MMILMKVSKKFKGSPREQMMMLEQEIYAQQERVIEDSVVATDPIFKKYQARYQKAIKSYQNVATVEVVMDEIASSRVVLVGDYHTLDQSQRSFVRVLRHFFKAHSKKVLVMLETVEARHQKILDTFMLGRIDPQAFIKKIGFKKSWFFDLWDNYAVIFDYLRFHGVPTFAMDASRAKPLGLKARDEFMAEQIVKRAKEYPEHIIFVLVGDLHLEKSHLPQEIKKCARKHKVKLPLLALHQNSPQIYWQLSKKQIVDHTLIVKISAGSYCRMHTPPLIVQQSYLNWLYHEEGSFDWIDAQASFLHLLEQISKILKLTLPQGADDVMVYTCGDLSFMEELTKSKKLSNQDKAFVKHQVERNDSFVLPEQHIVYIANVSLHHAAEEATHYLKILITGPEHERTPLDAFYANVLHEMIGFFGSKLINPKRKCQKRSDFRKEMQYLKKTEQILWRSVDYATAEAFLEQDRLVLKKKLLPENFINSLTSELFLSLTHAIGYDLGDKLYYAFVEGRYSVQDVRSLFENPFRKKGEPGNLYLKISKALLSIQRPGAI